MPLEIKKQEKETSQNLVRRFSKRLKNSGILFRARRGRFQKRNQSPQLKKKSALRREELKKEFKRLEKLGNNNVKRGNKRRSY